MGWKTAKYPGTAGCGSAVPEPRGKPQGSLNIHHSSFYLLHSPCAGPVEFPALDSVRRVLGRSGVATAHQQPKDRRMRKAAETPCKQRAFPDPPRTAAGPVPDRFPSNTPATRAAPATTNLQERLEHRASNRLRQSPDCTVGPGLSSPPSAGTCYGRTDTFDERPCLICPPPGKVNRPFSIWRRAGFLACRSGRLSSRQAVPTGLESPLHRQAGKPALHSQQPSSEMLECPLHEGGQRPWWSLRVALG